MHAVTYVCSTLELAERIDRTYRRHLPFPIIAKPRSARGVAETHAPSDAADRGDLAESASRGAEVWAMIVRGGRGRGSRGEVMRKKQDGAFAIDWLK